MSNYSPFAFGLTFNGKGLIADPTDKESLMDAMTRTIEAHAGSSVALLGRCKRTGEHYRYPVLLDNGVSGHAIIEGNV
ncbi:hypothetical protein ACI77O_12520 [Pseudomonas tritici]|uniref:hypothetical protein n=1 Tax=Pseudomonas tritici TaxID=2745518 RepID=UPI00387B148E